MKTSVNSGARWLSARRTHRKDFTILAVCLASLLSLSIAAAASGAWTPSRTVSGEDVVQRDFGQAVAPDGSGTVVWSAPGDSSSEYLIYGRDIGVDGSPGDVRQISAADPAAVLTTASSPSAVYMGSTVTVVWLESIYDDAVCLNDPYASPPEPGEECVVGQYVKARQIAAGGSLGPIVTLDRRETIYPAEGPFGATGGAFVSYGQPELSLGPGGTVTVLWSEGEFAAGCSAYGYSYEAEGCVADHSVKWVRITASGSAAGEPEVLFTSHSSGYGAAQSPILVDADADSTGTTTVVLASRTGDEESGCWGGETSIETRRIGSDSNLSPLEEIDRGCGWTDPKLALASDGAATVVWAWAEPYAANEIRYSRIPAGGAPEEPQPLVTPDPEMRIAAPDVAFGGGTATAIWGADGALQARSIPTSGPLGSVRMLAGPASPALELDSLDLALASDGTGVAVWEAGKVGGHGFEAGVRAIELAPDGTPSTVRTLLSPSRWDHAPRADVGSGDDFITAWRLSTPHADAIQIARPLAGLPQANNAFLAAEEVAGALPRFAAGSNESATKEGGEPDHAGDAGGASLWYSWAPVSSGPVSISTCSADALDALLAVYTGENIGGLTQVRANDDSGASECAPGDSEVHFNAVAGTTYHIAVDGKSGSQGSFGLELTELPQSLVNDDFAQARQLGSGLPWTEFGSNVGATKEAGEPDHAGDAGGASLWYSWTAPFSGQIAVLACGQGQLDPLLGVYTGSGFGDLAAVASDDDGATETECAVDDSEVRFNAVAGTTYRIAVDGKAGSEGFFTLRLIQPPANDDFASPNVLSSGLSAFVSGENRLATKEAGEPDHAGQAGGASLWYSWTPNVAGEVTIRTCSFGSIDPVLSVYTGSSFAQLSSLAGNDDAAGSCSADDATVKLTVATGTTYRIAVDAKGTARGFFSLSIWPRPANDAFAAATPLLGEGAVQLSGTNSTATKEAGEPNHAGDPGGASLWYSWTASKSGQVKISTCTFGFDSLLAVYTGTSVGGLTAVAANDNSAAAGCSPGSSATSFEVTAGTTYRIAVDGKFGAQGSFDLKLEPGPANDDFEGARSLTEAPPFTASGSTVAATRQPGEPEHAGNAGGASVWFSWTAPSNGTVGVSVCSGGSLKPLLGVYTGSSLGALSLVASNGGVADGYCFAPHSEVRFAAVAGTTYRIAVDGRDGSEGSFNLEMLQPPSNDDFAAADPIGSALPGFRFGSNLLAGKQAGEPDHSGDPGGASVWYSWTAAESGPVQVSICGFAGLHPALGVYAGGSLEGLSAIGTGGPADPECFGFGRTIAFAATAGTTYRIAVDGEGGGEGSFELSLRGRPANDDFVAARSLNAGLPDFVFGDNRLASKQEGEPDHAGSPGGASVWYRWQPKEAQTVTISTCASAPLDTLLAVYAGATLDQLSMIAANDDGGKGECAPGDSKTTFAADAGTAYWIAVDGKNGGAGSFSLYLRRKGPDNDDFADATEIAQPRALISGTTRDATSEAGEGASIFPSPAHTVWYRWTAPTGGRVSLHTCTDSGGPMDLHVFTGTTVNSLTTAPAEGPTAGSCAAVGEGAPPPVGNGSIAFSFMAKAGATYRISVDAPLLSFPSFGRTEGGPFVLALNGPENDLRVRAERLPAGGATVARSNSGASKEAGEADHAGDPGGASVWFRWFARADGPVSIDTCGSAIDTLLGVEEDDFSSVASGDDSEACGPGSSASALSFEAVEGTDYAIAVDGKGGASGAISLHVVFGTPDTTPPETNAYVPNAVNTSQLYASVFPDEPESGFECALDDAPFAPCTIEDLNPATKLIKVSGLSEGAHSLEVREVDLAGNPDPTPLRAEFKVDTVPPETTIDSGPEGLTRFLGSFGFSANEPAFFFECGFDEGPFSSCSSPFAPGALADGSHTFRVRAIDEAFNTDGSPATRSFTLDRVPPVTTIDQGPSGLVESASVSFEFSADGLATFHCRLDSGPTVDCESPKAYAALKDGDHVFSLSATDAAGNESDELTREFRVEARPPDTTIEAAPAARTKATFATFGFKSDELDSTFECALDGSPFAPCTPPHTVTELTDGKHDFSVRAVDFAGKPDPTPSEYSWTVDTVPPETKVDEGPSGLTHLTGPFYFLSSEQGSSFECALDGAASFSFCPDGYFLPPTSDGKHVLRVRAVDAAGNVDQSAAEWSLTLDTVAPVVEILSAPPAVTKADVTVEFDVDDEAAVVDCALDGAIFAPCASPAEFNGLEDGPHAVLVRATDSAGNETVAVTDEFVVDELPPDTFIFGEPAEYTGETSASVAFGGTADAVRFQCSLDGLPFAECTSPVTYDDLEDGPHRVRVFAIDGVGNVDATPEESTFVVDTVAPQTTIISAPGGPVHDLSVPFEFESSEEGGPFQCSMDGSPFGSCDTIEHDRRVGEHLFRVRARDLAGNVDPTPAEHTFSVVNLDPAPSLALDRLEGAAPLAVTATIDGEDADEDPLRYELQFGDGSTSTGELSHPAVSHTYTQPGVYLVRLELDDGYGEAVVTKTVTVSPPEPLVARAGDDRTAIAGEPIVLDGGNSRPLHGIDGYSWSFGDGATGTGETVEHVYGSPGEYEAELTVSRPGGTATDSASIEVVPPPAGDRVDIAVRGDGTPLPGADVLVILPSGRRVQAVSGASGTARLHGLPDGSHKVYVYKSGFVPAVGDVAVADSSGDGVVDMHSGELATATVDSHPMTIEEIEAAGIDPNDPANQHIYQFEVHLDLDPPWAPPEETITKSIRGMVGRSGFINPHCERITPMSCRTRYGGGVIYTTVTWAEGANAPLISDLVIPFRATFLKEFYEVSMIVSNLAAPGFTLRNGSAAIEVPSGMSLAPTAKAQSTSLDVADIPGGGSAKVNWVLRGDVEGEYDLAAHYGASLEPFGRSVKLDARTADPIKVWGGSALRLEVDVDDAALHDYPYTVFVKLENVADVPVYNPSVELLKEGRVGYIEQPRQRREYAVRELLPGTTHVSGPFIIVPEPSGNVDLSQSFIRKTAGDVDLKGTIVTHDRVPPFDETPQVEARGYGSKLVLDWEPIAGAGGYQVFQTLDRQVDFPPDPLSVRQLDASRAVVDGVDPDEPAFYAISSLLDVPTMVHPLTVAAGETNNDWPKIAIDPGDRCDQRDDAVELRFEALDFELADYEVFLHGTPLGGPRPLSGLAGSAVEHVPFPEGAGDDKDVTLEVVVHDVEGTQKRATADLSCNYVALGDSYSAGEGVPTQGTPGDPGAFEGISDHNGCHRSRIAYSHLVKDQASRSAVGDQLKFYACSGAKLAEIDHDNANGEPRQLNRLDTGTHLVTISIGGNDMYFGPIIEACILFNSRLDPTCRDDHRKDFEDGYKKVQNELPDVLWRIRQRAPGARILVVAYPQIFPSIPYDIQDVFEFGIPIVGGPLASCHQLLLDNVNPWDVVWLSDIQKRANAMIEEVVNDSASGAEYVSLGGRFSGHDVCQEVDPWINGGLYPHTGYSFHPNGEGQEAMADAVLAKLGQPRPSNSFRIDLGEAASRTYNVRTGPLGRAGRAFFSQWWPGSDVELTLESPAGRVIDRGTEAADVEHDLGPTSEIYTIDDPEPGEWTMKFKGLDVAPGGELVNYEATTEEVEENLPPTADFTQSPEGTRPGQPIAFDAGGSSDGDGEIVSYEWNFDDGSEGAGKTVEHSFAAPGLYEVRLLVRDDHAQPAFFAQKEIWVRKPPTAVGDHYLTTSGGSLAVAAASGVLANDTVDLLGGAAEAVATSSPEHGSLSLASNGGFEYRPAAGFSGADSFTYRASDAGGFDSSPATVTIAVVAPKTPSGDTADARGAGPPSPPLASPAAPDTRIDKVRGRGKRVSVWFGGIGAGPFSFGCALDSRKFEPCTSPKTYRGLKPGKHTVRVRAQSGSELDQSPASATLKTKKRKKRRSGHG